MQSVVSYRERITEIEFRIIRKPSIVPRRRRYYKWYPSLFPREMPWKYLQNALGTPSFMGFSQWNQQNTLLKTTRGIVQFENIYFMLGPRVFDEIECLWYITEYIFRRQFTHGNICNSATNIDTRDIHLRLIVRHTVVPRQTILKFISSFFNVNTWFIEGATNNSIESWFTKVHFKTSNSLTVH